MIVFYSEQIHHSGATAAVIVSQLTELEAMRPFFFNRPLQGAAMAVTVFVRGVLQSLIGAWLVSRRPRALAAA
ncbi:MAG: hypothetical protein JNN30_13720 [Rhodanobacteraceae bacterium]|nr:hypothetical protein [Rhodanobacteraceae bacterium]